MLFEFGPFQLDLATCELRREGESVSLQPRVFGVLRYLIEHRDRVVGKQELIDALWGGYQLNAVAVPWTINRARKALGDQPNGSRYIETMRGHGYRFVAELLTDSDAALQLVKTPPPSMRPEAARVSLAERPFVGRAGVMTQLTAALEAAAEGHGSLVLLSGEAGIGKTRCADELALLARRRGLQVWVGRCFQHGIAPAFWPFVQIVRAATSDSSLSDLLRREGETLLRELGPRRAPAEFTPASGSGDDRFWLLDRLSRWLVRSAHTQARVIELEDVHCADEGSLEALSLLAPMLAQARLLVVVTTRDVASVAGRSSAALAMRLKPCEHVPLTGLRTEDIETYLRAVLGDTLAAQLGQALNAKAAGNPLFLHEVTRDVSAQYARDGHVSVADVRLPAAVTEIIGARLRDLDASTRAVLDAACVIGEEFSLPVVQRVTKLSATDVLKGFEAAAAVRIIERRLDGTKHSFTHPLMREVLYATLSTVQRAHLHAAVGLALEAFGLIEPPLNELAYHFHHAPLDAYYERALRYARLAGNAAMLALAYDEAVQCYAWALEAQTYTAAQDIAGTCELLLRSGAALALSARGLESRRQCQRAIELASGARLPHVLIQAARQLRPSIWLAHIPDDLAVKALEQALQILPESEVALRAQAHAQLAVLPPYSRRLASSLQMSAEALRLAGKTNDNHTMLEAQQGRLYALSGPCSLDEQLEVAELMLRQGSRHTWRWVQDAHIARYYAYMQRGDTASAERALGQCERIVSELRLPFVMWSCRRFRALRFLHAGQLDEAEHRFAALWAESKRMKWPLALMAEKAHSSVLHFERTGKRLITAFSELPEVPHWLRAVPTFRVHRLLLALEAGEVELARREFHSLAQDSFSVVTVDSVWLSSLAHLTIVAIALGEDDAACVLRELLMPYASLIALTPFAHSLGSVSRYLGLLEQFLGRGPQARVYFERAVETNARIGHELERLRTMLDLARLLALGDSCAERAEARQLVGCVSESAQNAKLDVIAASARDLEATLTSEKVSSIAAPSAKSTRRSARTAKTPRSRL